MAAGSSALLIALGGGAIGVATLAMDDDRKARIVTADGVQTPEVVPTLTVTPGYSGNVHLRRGRSPIFPGHAAVPRTRAPETRAPETQAPEPRETQAPAARVAPRVPVRVTVRVPKKPEKPRKPVTVSRIEVETREIPYETRVVRDPALPIGSKRIDTPGAAGVETLRYLVTVTGGKPVGRKLVYAAVTRPPQLRIVAVGTGRDPDYDCGERALDVCVPALIRTVGCPESAAVPADPGLAGLGGTAVVPADPDLAGVGGSVPVVDADLGVLAGIPAC
jgi:hypothetical protein